MRALVETMKHMKSKMDEKFGKMESKMDERFEKLDKLLTELTAVCSEF